MRQLAFKASGIKGAADLRGRRVAVWLNGNEFELFATLESMAPIAPRLAAG